MLLLVQSVRLWFCFLSAKLTSNIFASVTQLYHIPLDAGLSSIVWCSLCDPYAVMMTTDGSLLLLEFTMEDSEPKVKISRPQLSQVSLWGCTKIPVPFKGMNFSTINFSCMQVLFCLFYLITLCIQCSLGALPI